jgi:probable F420-dependent oxidoreductase
VRDLKLGLYGIGIGVMAGPNSAGIARFAEELGYESVWTGEHMVLPFPRDALSHRDPLDPMLDPIVALTYVAAQTSSLLIGTGVLLAPQRHPVHLAKELASLDVLSRGRVIAGLGIGYLTAEMAALGVDSRQRVPRLVEAIRVMRSLWAGDVVQLAGEFTTASGVVARPVPTRPRGVPVILGGNSRAAKVRAFNHADGWYGFRVSVEEAAASVRLFRDLAQAEYRSDHIEITITPTGPVTEREIGRYEAAGVDRLVIPLEVGTLGEIREVVKRWAPSRVIS